MGLKQLFFVALSLLGLAAGLAAGAWISQKARDPFLAGDYGNWEDWHLGVPENGKGRLRYLPGDEEVMRAEYVAEVKEPWQIQLSRKGFQFEANQRYRLSFRAKGDQARPITLLCLEAQAPFQNLGLYQQIKLTDAWQEFHFEFPANKTDDNAVVCFNLGESQIPLEVANVTLEKLPAP
ncbi:MAG: carbohydrate binding domain-containing protein [Planctomycetota bacterium]